MRSRSSVSRVHARAIFFRCNFLSFFPVPGWKRPWPDMRASGEARGTIIEPHKPHRTWPILSTRAPGKTNSPSPSASYWRLIRVSLQSSCPLTPFSAASFLSCFFSRTFSATRIPRHDDVSLWVMAYNKALPASTLSFFFSLQHVTTRLSDDAIVVASCVLLLR